MTNSKTGSTTPILNLITPTNKNAETLLAALALLNQNKFNDFYLKARERADPLAQHAAAYTCSEALYIETITRKLIEIDLQLQVLRELIPHLQLRSRTNNLVNKALIQQKIEQITMTQSLVCYKHLLKRHINKSNSMGSLFSLLD